MCGLLEMGMGIITWCVGGGVQQCRRRVLDAVLEDARQAVADGEQRDDGHVTLGVTQRGPLLSSVRTTDVDVAMHGHEHRHVHGARVSGTSHRPTILVYVPGTTQQNTSQ